MPRTSRAARATRRRRLDRPAFPRRPEGAAGRGADRKTPRLLEETSEKLVEDIAKAAATGDPAQLARSAHQLGSAASALGLVRLFEFCREIELAAVTMSPPECQSAAREIAALRKASISALDDLLRSA